MRRPVRYVVAGLCACLLLAGCATRPDSASAPPPRPIVRQPEACVPPVEPIARPGYCALPVEVRAFIDDRDACDHFRDEPWPEGDTDDDLARRRELVERVRTLCAGTDRRLLELLGRYRDDPATMQILSTYETGIEATP